ncbi:ryanodine receptor 3 isoform X3 [Silurus meridionalis]|nr:ryanodine receptor 3 isoform X3 [Silurus meridionalis]
MLTADTIESQSREEERSPRRALPENSPTSEEEYGAPRHTHRRRNRQTSPIPGERELASQPGAHSRTAKMLTTDTLESRIRDDNKQQHPCLVDFSKLPETERNYNLQMSTETLKTLLALGCHVVQVSVDAEEELKKIKLPKNYMMSNGYKPMPLELSEVKLSPAQELLVDKLAENGHNVWAKDRVKQGWTYGIQQDLKSRRNPRLVPYALLDERTKKSNRDSLREAIRTLIGYGYNIEPPDQEAGHVVERLSIDKIRFFRLERTYAVKTGKWYFEFEVVTGGDMRVGWARPGVRPDLELGTDDQAFVFDGYKGHRLNQGSYLFGRCWHAGDVVGCMINMEDKSMIFTLNGEILITNKGSELCFADFDIKDGFIPVCSLGLSQVGRMNLGKDASSFKYYTMCGLQEGFEPFAVNMNREVTMWFSKRLPTFVTVPKDQSHIAVMRIDSTIDSPPCLKVTHKTFGTQNSNTDMVFCRLSMPVEFYSTYKSVPATEINGVHEEEPLKLKYRYPVKSMKHVDDGGRTAYSNITTYYHSVRVFAGQDPKCVWVGWVTPDYHYYSNLFNLSKNRSVTITLGDERGRVHERRSNCYMVWGGDAISSSHSSNRSNVDLEIGCLIDLATGLVAFTVNGKELPISYQVEPNTKLFPAVFVHPTSPNLFQFELTKIKVAPSHKRSGTSLRSILRRHYSQFKLFFLATEAARFIEHLSTPTIPENPCLPPRILQHTFTHDMGTQTSCDLPAVYHQKTQTDNEDYDDSRIPATNQPSPPYLSCWSPTDYSPTSSVLSHNYYYPPITSPESDPDCSPMSSAASEAHKHFFPNKHA